MKLLQRIAVLQPNTFFAPPDSNGVGSPVLPSQEVADLVTTSQSNRDGLIEGLTRHDNGVDQLIKCAERLATRVEELETGGATLTMYQEQVVEAVSAARAEFEKAKEAIEPIPAKINKVFSGVETPVETSVRGAFDMLGEALRALDAIPTEVSDVPARAVPPIRESSTRGRTVRINDLIIIANTWDKTALKQDKSGTRRLNIAMETVLGKKVNWNGPIQGHGITCGDIRLMLGAVMALINKPDDALSDLVEKYLHKLPADDQSWMMADTARRRKLGRNNKGVWHSSVLISIFKHPQLDPRKIEYKKLKRIES